MEHGSDGAERAGVEDSARHEEDAEPRLAFRAVLAVRAGLDDQRIVDPVRVLLLLVLMLLLLSRRYDTSAELWLLILLLLVSSMSLPVHSSVGLSFVVLLLLLLLSSLLPTAKQHIAYVVVGVCVNVPRRASSVCIR